MIQTILITVGINTVITAMSLYIHFKVIDGVMTEFLRRGYDMTIHTLDKINEKIGVQ